MGDKGESSVLLIGNFLSTNGNNRSTGEDLAERLRAKGRNVLTTSSKSGMFIVVMLFSGLRQLVLY
jgi:hypothetical protein